MELIQTGNRLTPARLNADQNAVKLFAATGTLSSGSYVNIPGDAGAATSFSFVKHSTSSRIEVLMKITAFSDAGSTGLRLGVRINSIDYDVALGYYTTANQYLPALGFATVTNGQAAGTYTLQARWKRSAGAGIINVHNAISELDMSAREVI